MPKWWSVKAYSHDRVVREWSTMRRERAVEAADDWIQSSTVTAVYVEEKLS